MGRNRQQTSTSELESDSNENRESQWAGIFERFGNDQTEAVCFDESSDVYCSEISISSTDENQPTQPQKVVQNIDEHVKSSVITVSPDKSSSECTNGTSSSTDDESDSSDISDVRELKHGERASLNDKSQEDYKKIRNQRESVLGRPINQSGHISNQREHVHERPSNRRGNSSYQREQPTKHSLNRDQLHCPQSTHDYRLMNVTLDELTIEQKLKEEKERERRRAAWVFNNLSCSRLSTSADRTKSFRSSKERERRKAAWVFNNLSSSRLSSSTGRAKRFKSLRENDRRKKDWVLRNLSCSRLYSSSHLAKSSHSMKTFRRSERTDRILNISLDGVSSRESGKDTEKKKHSKLVRKDNPFNTPDSSPKQRSSKDYSNYRQKTSRPSIPLCDDSDLLPGYDLEQSTSYGSSQRKQLSLR